jgi:hypothetical protein
MLDEFSDIVAEEDARFLAVAAQVAESAQHIHQHTQPVILSCSGCSFEGWYGKECNNCSRSTRLVDKYTPK